MLLPPDGRGRPRTIRLRQRLLAAPLLFPAVNAVDFMPPTHGIVHGVHWKENLAALPPPRGRVVWLDLGSK